ncbi:hypothetical protein ACWD6K_32375, partial [Streptomyces sp. NPDC002431]
FHTVAKPVNRAIDKIINLITKAGKKLWNKLKGKGANGKDGKKSSDVKKKARERLASSTRTTFRSEKDLDSLIRKVLVDLKPEGLKSLHAKPKGGDTGSYTIIARASPSTPVGSAQVSPAGEPTGEEKKEIMKGMKHYLPIHAGSFLPQVYQNWWGSQLAKSNIGNQKIWPDQSIFPAREGPAKEYLVKSTTREKLLPHFSQDRMKPYGHTKIFADYVFVKSASSDHSVRREFLKELGDSAVPKIKNKGISSVEKLENDSTKKKELLGKLENLKFNPDESDYGKFSPLPNSTPSPDKLLKDTVDNRGIIDFMKDMASKKKQSGAISLADLKNYWNGKEGEFNPNRDFLKKEFRKLKPGHHEWIPTDYMIRMIEVAVEQGHTPSAVQWIDLQDNLRSFTAHVIWKIRVVDDPTQTGSHQIDAHAGAFADSLGNHIFNGRDSQWHDDLRGYFDRFIEKTPKGTPKEFLEFLTALLDEGKLMWNGDDTGYTEEQKNIIIEATYKAVTVEPGEVLKREFIQNIKLQDLALRQRANYDRVKLNFKEAAEGLL